MSVKSESHGGPDAEPIGDLRHRCGKCSRSLVEQRFAIVNGDDLCLLCAPDEVLRLLVKNLRYPIVRAGNNLGRDR